jgi:hypothetical protein
MSTYSETLMEELIEAWYKLQAAHLDFEQAPDGTKLFKDRYDALLDALQAYERALQRVKPPHSMDAIKERALSRHPPPLAALAPLVLQRFPPPLSHSFTCLGLQACLRRSSCE